MNESVYNKIGKEVGRDVRFVRTVAHHPFEFFSKVMEDPKDHRPMRFRYLGVFFVKPYWKKGLRNSDKIGLPPDGISIWARVPMKRFSKTYFNLRSGSVVDRIFYSDEGDVCCPVEEVKFWTKI